MTIHVTQSMTQVQPYEKAEPCCQPVSHSSSSRSHPESWHSSAAAHRRQQNTAVSHVISRDNGLLRDREDVQPLSSAPVSCLAEADHLLHTGGLSQGPRSAPLPCFSRRCPSLKRSGTTAHLTGGKCLSLRLNNRSSAGWSWGLGSANQMWRQLQAPGMDPAGQTQAVGRWSRGCLAVDGAGWLCRLRCSSWLEPLLTPLCPGVHGIMCPFAFRQLKLSS